MGAAPPLARGMANADSELEYARGYLPMWAGPPLQGGICARLLVNKHGRLITTIDFDQRAFISLGRSTDKVTYSLHHPSVSRLHALIVHHQRLQAYFLIDCGSAHGTYLAGKRIEPKVPVRIAEGTRPSEPIHFGGSSRVYVLQGLALDGRTDINTHINQVPLALEDRSLSTLNPAVEAAVAAASAAGPAPLASVTSVASENVPLSSVLSSPVDMIAGGGGAGLGKGIAPLSKADLHTMGILPSILKQGSLLAYRESGGGGGGGHQMEGMSLLPSSHSHSHSHRRKEEGGRGADVYSGAGAQSGGASPQRPVSVRVGASTKSPPPEILKTPLLDAMEGFHPAQRSPSPDTSHPPTLNLNNLNIPKRVPATTGMLAGAQRAASPSASAPGSQDPKLSFGHSHAHMGGGGGVESPKPVSAHNKVNTHVKGWAKAEAVLAAGQVPRHSASPSPDKGVEVSPKASDAWPALQGGRTPKGGALKADAAVGAGDLDDMSMRLDPKTDSTGREVADLVTLRSEVGSETDVQTGASSPASLSSHSTASSIHASFRMDAHDDMEHAHAMASGIGAGKDYCSDDGTTAETASCRDDASNITLDDVALDDVRSTGSVDLEDMHAFEEMPAVPPQAGARAGGGLVGGEELVGAEVGPASGGGGGAGEFPGAEAGGASLGRGRRLDRQVAALEGVGRASSGRVSSWVARELVAETGVGGGAVGGLAVGAHGSMVVTRASKKQKRVSWNDDVTEIPPLTEADYMKPRYGLLMTTTIVIACLYIYIYIYRYGLLMTTTIVQRLRDRDVTQLSGNWRERHRRRASSVSALCAAPIPLTLRVAYHRRMYIYMSTCAIGACRAVCKRGS